MANSYGVKSRGSKWTAAPYIPGLKKRVWAGTWDTQEEAVKAALAKIEQERRLPAHKETVASFAARWISDFPRPKPSTNDTYDFAAKRFAEQYGGRKLHEITVPEAMEWARKHPHDVPPLRAMYGDARRSGLVTEVPFAKLGVSKGRGRSDIVPITEEELGLLGELAVDAHGKEYGPIFRSLIIFAAYTTMRPSEIAGLDVPDIDLKAETIRVERQFYKRHIQPPKYGKRKLPYIPPQAAKALREMPRRVPRPICPITGNEIVFCGKQGQRITQPSLSLYWQPVRTAFEAKLEDGRREELRSARRPDKPEMDFYELRHFGATLMAELGVEPWVAAEMMGHRDGGELFRTRYSHPRNEVAQERLRRAFGQNVKPLHAVEKKEATG